MVLKVNRLPEELLIKIESLINKAPRTGLELLLVSAGVKTGDKVSSIYYPISSEVINIINLAKKQGVNIDYKLIEKSNGLKELLYFKTTISDELISKVNELIINNSSDDKVMGSFYGYPSCCVNNYKPSNKNHSFTEHKWCSDNCPESIKLSKLYHEAVMINLPQYEYLIERFSFLMNGLPDLTMIWNEMHNKNYL